MSELLDVKLNDGDDDDDTKNEFQHRNLKKTIYEISGKHKNLELRKELSNNILNIQPLDKVSLGDLISKDSKNVELLETKNKLSKEALVEKPMFKGELEKIRRQIGYDQAIKVTTEWDTIVNENRKATQIKFPLMQTDVLSIMNTKEVSKEQKPASKLEQEVAKMLKESNRSKLSHQEEKALLSHLDNSLHGVNLKGAQEMRAEFLRQKALVSYYAAKMKRQNKIKSKKYHRIQKKARSKQEGQKLEALKDKDPEAYNEWLLKEEKKRIEERMTLKHKGASKHMKKQMLYGKFNSESRQAVNDMLEKGRELTQKQINHNSDDDDDCESDDVLSEEEENESITKESTLKKRHLDDDDDFQYEKTSKKVKKPKMDLTDVLESVPFEACDELLEDGKDILSEFKEEKAMVEERDKVKDVNLFMEGWGSWSGKGIKMPKKKLKRFIIKAPDAPPRKDHKLNHVIISELKDEAVAKHQVDALPWKFNNVHEFQESIRKPVGKQWNKEDQYRQKIKPKVVIKPGSVIEPINKSEALKNYGSNSSDKRFKK